MPHFDPDRHHRRSIRLPAYDYGQAGFYFITVCTHGRVCSLGEINDGVMQSSEAGCAVSEVWSGLPQRFPFVGLDAFVLMPNHVHGIVVLGAVESPAALQGAINHAPTLGEVVRAFKAASTRFVRTSSNPGFAWQRNYYEHVIRNDRSLEEIRTYIEGNPAGWESDDLHP